MCIFHTYIFNMIIMCPKCCDSVFLKCIFFILFSIWHNRHRRITSSACSKQQKHIWNCCCVSVCLWFFCSAVYLFLMEHIYVVFLLKSYFIRNSVKFQVRWIFFSLPIPSIPHCWVAPPLLTFLFSILFAFFTCFIQIETNISCRCVMMGHFGVCVCVYVFIFWIQIP